MRRRRQPARGRAEVESLLSAHATGLSAIAPPVYVGTRGALAVRKAIDYAIQIARGLAAAHDNGIAHRDLKPENIIITADSRVKILDFGLAKLVESEANVGLNALSIRTIDQTHLSPHTAPGVVLGTVGYMSPEQVRGEETDHRGDIFAFGAVLYEMLAGERAFHGPSGVETLAAVLNEEPPSLSLTGRNIPPSLDRLVRKCLEKAPASRFQSASDLAFAVEEIRAQSEVVVPEPKGRFGVFSSARIAWAITGVLATGVAVFLGTGALTSPTNASSDAAYRLALPPPPGAMVPVPGLASDRHLPLSPDGRRLAFVAQGSEGERMLWVRSLDAQTVVQPLSGTEGAQAPFWSPDSQWIGFFTVTELKKIAATGGPALTLFSCTINGTGTWSRDDVILFGSATALHRIPATGGTPTVVRSPDLDAGEAAYQWPVFLPDGRHFLYRVNLKTNERIIYLGALDSNDGKPLVRNTNATYAREHLVFMQGSTLMAQPFDLSRLEMTGQALVIADGVLASAQGLGSGAFTVSEAGVLAYQPDSAESPLQLAWFDRTGKQLGTVSEGVEGELFDVELSPDGKRAAVSIARRGRDIWVYDVVRNVPTRFTLDPGNDFASVWSPDGSRIVFESTRSGQLDLYQKDASGAGAEHVLLQADGTQRVYSWSPDGRYILYGTNRRTELVDDLWVLPLRGDQKPFPLLDTEFRERFGRFSPDGRWIVYVSDETGRDEIYVTPFPDADGKWRISNAGGTLPRWRRDGREIFYVAPDSRLMAVAVDGQHGAFEVGSAERLFPVRSRMPQAAGYAYDASADGQRFLVNTLSDRAGFDPLTIVVNWPALLK